jgi:hypothetical protein
MTLTLDNFSEDDENALRKMYEQLRALGDPLGGWWIDSAQLHEKSAQLNLKWEKPVSPLANQALPAIFEEAPAKLVLLLTKLLNIEDDSVDTE